MGIPPWRPFFERGGKEELRWASDALFLLVWSYRAFSNQLVALFRFLPPPPCEVWCLPVPEQHRLRPVSFDFFQGFRFVRASLFCEGPPCPSPILALCPCRTLALREIPQSPLARRFPGLSLEDSVLCRDLVFSVVELFVSPSSFFAWPLLRPV